MAIPNIMSLFSSPKAAPSQQSVQQPQNNNNNQSNNPNNANADNANNQNQGFNANQGNNPSGNGNNQNSQQPKETNPLDSFSKMWDNPGSEADTPPAYALDPKVLTDIAGKQDFMQGIDPELMTKAQSGDVQSMFQVMQAMSRGVYARSLEHGGMLTDKFVGAREAHSGKGLGGRVRKELTEHALSDTPNYQHPVVRKQLNQVAEQLQRQHPDASPKEIANMAKSYITELASALNPKDETATKQKPGAQTETDWDKYWEADEMSDQNG